MNIANLVQQTISADSPADLFLGNAVSSFVTMNAAFQDGDKVFYSVKTGNDREIGYGTFNSGPNTITRNTLFEQVVAGVFDDAPATPLNVLTGSIVSCSPSIQGLTTHIASFNRLPAIQGLADGAYAVSSPDTGAILGNIEGYLFDASVIENIPVGFSVPHNIEEDTNLIFEAHFVPTTADVGVVRFGLEYFILAQENNVVSSSIIVAEGVTQGVTNQHLVAEFPAIVMPEPGSKLLGRFFREANHPNDNYVADVGYLGLDGKFQATRVGTPQGVPNFYNWN